MARDPEENSVDRHGFVSDGDDRLATAIRPSIEKDVEAEFAGRLITANWIERIILRREMRREIERRVASQMPSEETLW